MLQHAHADIAVTDQVFDVEWFRQESIGIDLIGSLACVCGRGDHHNRSVRTGLRAVGTRKFPAVHDRHAHIQQYQPGQRGGDHIQGLRAISGAEDSIAGIRKHPVHGEPQPFIVLYHQDLRRGLWLCGRHQWQASSCLTLA